MADNQFLLGYCLLLANPIAGQLLDLEEFQRHQFLMDMASLGDAIKNATGAVRINFGIYGNLDPFLHAHIWPRYDDEPFSRKTVPPATFPETFRNDPETAWSPETHGILQALIRSELEKSL